mmetsp:Transcript_53635/g.92278  ORF Transcript_53635/g.92278 Transcript_53635/m.92278 type:complete len:212 (+) Transcript_53635:90-725(+)
MKTHTLLFNLVVHGWMTAAISSLSNVKTPITRLKGDIFNRRNSCAAAMASSDNHQLDRRSWLSFIPAAYVAFQPVVALAADPPPIEVHEGFAYVRQEIESGGVAKLDSMVAAGDWENILEFTKLYDLSFRKVELYRVATALLPIDKSKHDKAKEIRSTITYDLIAVNKASRPQFREIAAPASRQAMETLKKDLADFLALEPITGTPASTAD